MLALRHTAVHLVSNLRQSRTRIIASRHCFVTALVSLRPAPLALFARAPSRDASSSSSPSSALMVQDDLGQPSPFRHPHLMKPGELTPGIPVREFQARREALLSALPPSSAVVLIGAAQPLMANDIPYPFHQNADFAYFTGFLEKDAVALLQRPSASPGIPGSTQYTLFVPPRDPANEMWNGARCGVENAVRVFGADRAFSNTQLTQVLPSLLSSSERVFVQSRDSALHDETFATVTRVCNSLERRPEALGSVPERLRCLKSPAELALMQKAGDIAMESFVEGMKYTRPDMAEYDLYAKMQFESIRRGAKFLSFPPVFSGGPRSTTLHYVNNDQLLRDGELVLVDFGCEYHGYCSDVTRTWPVNGVFSPTQRQLYEAVLNVNEKCIQACNPRLYSADTPLSLSVLQMLARKFMEEEVRKLFFSRFTLSTGEVRSLSSALFPHYISHFLGMDTHDTPNLERGLPLKAGMVITIEPGLYTRNPSPHIPAEFMGVGIRVEDNVLIQDGPPVVLTREIPKQVSDIESVMRRA